MERTCEVSIEQDVNPLGSNRGKFGMDKSKLERLFELEPT